jgi:hypothetical protein
MTICIFLVKRNLNLTFYGGCGHCGAQHKVLLIVSLCCSPDIVSSLSMDLPSSKYVEPTLMHRNPWTYGRSKPQQSTVTFDPCWTRLPKDIIPIVAYHLDSVEKMRLYSVSSAFFHAALHDKYGYIHICPQGRNSHTFQQICRLQYDVISVDSSFAY